MVKVKAGQEFYAVVRKGPHSCTLEGVEGAGRRIGAFRASRDSTSLGVAAGSRFFCPHSFKIKVPRSGAVGASCSGAAGAKYGQITR